jgi:hypothetical protein
MLGHLHDDAQPDPQHSSDFYQHERNLLIECNIDDMSSEAYQPLLDAILKAGAKDAFLTPIIMKKSRPGITLSVLCDSADEQRLLDIIFSQSTSIGVRTHSVEKSMLPRELRSVATSFGTLEVKLVTLRDGRQRWKLEHDQLRELAQQHGLEYLELRRLLEAEVASALQGAP